MPSPISPIVKSLIRHCVDLIEDINATTSHQLQYWAWETRADEDKLPKETLLGLDNFHFSENQGLWDINCSIGLSSYKDKNLLGETELLDKIFDACHERQTITLRDPVSGAEIDQLVVTHFEISPMMESMYRNYRTVMLNLKRTSNALS